MGKIRSIAYSFDGKSVVRRNVGKSLDVEVDGAVYVITISSIEQVEHPRMGLFYRVYGRNSSGEEGLWKEVFENTEVEYDITDLLCGQ